MLIGYSTAPKPTDSDSDPLQQTNPDESTRSKFGFGFIGPADPTEKSELEVPGSFPKPAPKIKVQANAKRAAITELKTYLKGVEYCYEAGLEGGFYKELSPQDLTEIKNYCTYEPLMEQAVDYMKEIGSKDYNILKTNTQFSVLFKYPAFKKMVLNAQYYEKTARIRKSQASSVYGGDSKQPATSKVKGAGAKSEESKTDTAPSDEIKQDLLHNKPLLSVEELHSDMIEARQTMLAWQEWLDLMGRCEHLDYPERCTLLNKKYLEEPMRFIEQLHKYANEGYLHKLFSVLHYITNTLDSQGLPKLQLFVHSCGVYELELLYVDQKDWIVKNSKLIIEKLDNGKMTTQLLGYLKLLFVNDIILPESTAAELTHLLSKYKSVWGLFSQWLQGRPYTLNNSIVVRLPITGLLFTGSFPRMLKDNPTIFHAVPEDFRKLFIDICVLSSETCTETLAAFVKQQGHFVDWYDAPIRKAKVLELYNEAVLALQERITTWVSKLALLHQLCTVVIRGVVDKKIADVTTVLGAIRGDTEELEQQLQSAQLIEKGSTNDLLLIIERFKTLNAHDICVQEFDMACYNDATAALMQDIQQAFKRELHHLQLLCVNYVLQNLGNGSTFIKFGIGCGKTLLATTLAILISSLLKKPTIILGKFEYLPYRDHRKFKALVEKCGISTSHNELCTSGISYIDEAKFNDLWKSKPTRKQMLTYCLINDEFDWFMFDDGKVQTMQDKLLRLQQFPLFIGFSGSTLSTDETKCIKQVFGTSSIAFPTMKEIKGYQPTRYADIVTATEEDWFANIAERAYEMCKEVPVIIVASTKKAAAAIHKYLKFGAVSTDLAALNSKQKVQLLDIAIEKTFNKAGDDGTYGIYITHEELGRGTDFPTSAEIEAKGGISEIVTDVFESRAKVQIEGRVARMQNKGQLQNIVLCLEPGKLNQYIEVQQQVKNAYHTSTMESLLNHIRTQGVIPKKHRVCDDVRASFFVSGEYEEVKQDQMDYELNGDYEEVGSKIQALKDQKKGNIVDSDLNSDSEFKRRLNSLDKARLLKESEQKGDESQILRRSNRRKAGDSVETLEKNILNEIGAQLPNKQHVKETKENEKVQYNEGELEQKEATQEEVDGKAVINAGDMGNGDIKTHD